jgi:hypothetical protein
LRSRPLIFQFVITEVRERFIKSFAEKISPDRIVEAFFFPAIRQGPIETGVAVISVTPISVAVDSPPVERAEVFTAGYRWTRKGVERGKWVVEVTAEADAPLETVAKVVRGVQERAGEALDAHRMSGDEIRLMFPPATEAGTAAPEGQMASSGDSAPAESAA